MDVWYEGGWSPVVDEPIQEDHTWPVFSTSYTWYSYGSITVEAGTFHDCWEKRQNVAYDSYSVWCPGVGAVYDITDITGGWEAELVSKNF